MGVSWLTSCLWTCGTVILTGSVRFFGLGRLDKKERPVDGWGSRSSLDLQSAAACFCPSFLSADPDDFGAGRTENIDPPLGFLSAAAEVEVSSESLSSLLP